MIPATDEYLHSPGEAEDPRLDLLAPERVEVRDRLELHGEREFRLSFGEPQWAVKVRVKSVANAMLGMDMGEMQRGSASRAQPQEPAAAEKK